MAKGDSESAGKDWNAGRVSAVNTDELEAALFQAELRVLGIQTKLHRWARKGPDRRFGDLFNLVADPAFLLVAWARVRGNKVRAQCGAGAPTFDRGCPAQPSST